MIRIIDVNQIGDQEQTAGENRTGVPANQMDHPKRRFGGLKIGRYLLRMFGLTIKILKQKGYEEDFLGIALHRTSA